MLCFGSLGSECCSASAPRWPASCWCPSPPPWPWAFWVIELTLYWMRCVLPMLNLLNYLHVTDPPLRVHVGRASLAQDLCICVFIYKASLPKLPIMINNSLNLRIFDNETLWSNKRLNIMNLKHCNDFLLLLITSRFGKCWRCCHTADMLVLSTFC